MTQRPNMEMKSGDNHFSVPKATLWFGAGGSPCLRP